MGGVFVFGFPGIVVSAMKDELQGNFGKKNPKTIYEFALGKFAWVCVSDNVREDEC